MYCFRKSKKSIIIVLMSIFLITACTGCWNRRELDNIAIVFGVGIDKTNAPGEIAMTAQIITPANIKGATKEGGTTGKSYINLTSEGDTSFRTVRNFVFEASRKLFWAHNNIIIFGEDLAKEGLAKYLDFFLRDHELRRTVWVLIAKGRAGDLLDTNPGIERTPAMNIAKLIEDRKVSSQVAGVNLHEFATRLLSKTTSPVATLIDISEEKGQKTAKLVGTAVFKKDKMVGILTKYETRGMLWVLGEVGSGMIVVDAPKSSDKVTLEIIRASGEIVPEIKNDNLYMKIKIKEEGNLGCQMSQEDLTEPQAFSSLEKRQAQAIKKEIMASWEKAKSLNTDIFGFGDAVHRKYPKVWKEIEGSWDQYFPEIKLTLEVEAKLRRVGMTTKPPVPEK